MSQMTLDELPVVATAKAPRLSAEERERQQDWARSEAVRWASIEWHLRSALRFYSLADVQRMWFEVHATKKGRG